MRPTLYASGAPNEIQTQAALDARADGGRRMILLASHCITIKRRLRGMKMHLRVPVESYKGVILAREDHPSGIIFSIRLAHRDPELTISLQAEKNRRASIDAWRQWAAFFALPALVEGAGGRWEVIDSRPLAALGSMVAPRHSGPFLRRRRRLALCRKNSRIDGPAKLFRGEQVIISYD